MGGSVIEPTDIVGTWLLKHFAISIEGRAPLFPFGEDAEGMILYGATGHMSAVLSRRSRPPLGASRLETSSRTSPSRRAEAFDSYLSYAGRWRIEGNAVIHTVTMAMVPELVGQEMVRTASLHGGMLHLTYTIVPPSNNARNYELIWARP